MESFEGFDQIVDDLRSLPATLKPLLIADTLIRFGNGMVYVFWILVVTDLLNVGFQGFGVSLRPAAFFGILLGVEMAVAILTKVPVSKLAESTGLKPVVGLGFFVMQCFRFCSFMHQRISGFSSSCLHFRAYALLAFPLIRHSSSGQLRRTLVVV